MAKVQVVMAATLDGFLPESNEQLMQWVRTDRRGFSRWKEKAAYPLFPGYPLLDLICEKERMDETFIYYAEITDKDSVKLLHGLFLYHIVDEIILYLLPVTAGKGIHIMQHIPSGYWSLNKTRKCPGGICCMVYRKSHRLP